MRCPTPNPGSCPVWLLPEILDPEDADHVPLESDEHYQVQLYQLQSVREYVYSHIEYYLPGDCLFNECVLDHLPEVFCLSHCLHHHHAGQEPDCILAYNNIRTVAEFIHDTYPNIFRDYTATIAINRTGYASWISQGQQAIFYQFTQNGISHSTAGILDVVAHEFCHGIISNILRIDERQSGFIQAEESGALQESLCDIFAILVSNLDQPDIKTWKWTIGEGLGNGGGAVRDLANPTRCSHPNHIDDCKRLELGEKPNKGNDWGYIHTNCGIHNQAFHNLATPKNGNDDYIFNRDSLIDFFLRSLTKLLKKGNRDSGFVHSLRAMLEVAEELPEHDLHKNIKINRIREAFERVGIVDDRTVDRYSETVLIE